MLFSLIFIPFEVPSKTISPEIVEPNIEIFSELSLKEIPPETIVSFNSKSLILDSTTISFPIFALLKTIFVKISFELIEIGTGDFDLIVTFSIVTGSYPRWLYEAWG